MHRRHQAGGAGGETEPEGALGDIGDGDFPAVAEIDLQHVGDFIDEGGVGREGGDFEIQTEGAVVEIGGADKGVAVIHEHDFLVKEAALIAHQLDAVGDGFLKEGEGRKPDEKVIGFFRNQDAHVHATQGGGLKGGEDTSVGHEVGGGDPQPFGRVVGGFGDDQLPGVSEVSRAGGEDG